MGAGEGTRSHDHQPRPYRCFLVRCWQEDDARAGDEPAWRFTVQEAGEDRFRRSFSRFEDVEMYLETELKVHARHGAEQQKP
jgi:hypothetical protein